MQKSKLLSHVEWLTYNPRIIILNKGVQASDNIRGFKYLSVGWDGKSQGWQQLNTAHKLRKWVKNYSKDYEKGKYKASNISACTRLKGDEESVKKFRKDTERTQTKLRQNIKKKKIQCPN